MSPQLCYSLMMLHFMCTAHMCLGCRQWLVRLLRACCIPYLTYVAISFERVSADIPCLMVSCQGMC